jgi:hypothetical protein
VRHRRDALFETQSSKYGGKAAAALGTNRRAAYYFVIFQVFILHFALHLKGWPFGLLQAKKLVRIDNKCGITAYESPGSRLPFCGCFRDSGKRDQSRRTCAMPSGCCEIV